MSVFFLVEVIAILSELTLPSWELTYPLPRQFCIFFLFARSDMLVSWRVISISDWLMKDGFLPSKISHDIPN